MDFVFYRVSLLSFMFFLFFHIQLNDAKGEFFHCYRLIRYLYPTNQELRNLVGFPKEKHKKGKHTENGKLPDSFQIPRNLDITLETAPVTPLDIIHLKFYSDFQWLFDFSIYGILVYIMTEVLI